MEKRIENTVNKANKTLGFVRRNLSDCITPVKAAAYTTIVRLVLAQQAKNIGPTWALNGYLYGSYMGNP